MNDPALFPTLKTERLLLRQLLIEDDKTILFLRSNDAVNQYLDRPKTTTINEAREFINKINLGIQKGQSFYWAVSPLSNNELIGTICLWNRSEDKLSIEIGFELHPDFQGKGFMQEALSAVIKFVFQILNIQSISADVHKDNKKSIKLLEKNRFQIDKQRETENQDNMEFYNMTAYLLAK